MRRLVRLMKAIQTRKEECAALEQRIGEVLGEASGGTTLAAKLARLEELQLQRITLQSQKETLLRENDAMQQLIDTESQNLLANVETMERVQTTEMRRILECSVVMCTITTKLREEYVQLKERAMALKATFVAQLRRVYVIEKRVDPHLRTALFAFNGIAVPARPTPQDSDVLNEMVGDICHIVALLARYFAVRTTSG